MTMRDPVRLAGNDAPRVLAADALAEHERGRQTLPDLPREIPREVQEIVRKYKLLVARERKFGWLARKARFWLGINTDQTRFADKANELFTKEVEERLAMQQAIDELTASLNQLATSFHNHGNPILDTEMM